jgi:hypothetical protein
MPMTIQDELRKRLGLPADYDPNTDSANLLGREFAKRVALTAASINPEMIHLFKRLAWAALDMRFPIK